MQASVRLMHDVTSQSTLLRSLTLDEDLSTTEGVPFQYGGMSHELAPPCPAAHIPLNSRQFGSGLECKAGDDAEFVAGSVLPEHRQAIDKDSSGQSGVGIGAAQVLREPAACPPTAPTGSYGSGSSP